MEYDESCSRKLSTRNPWIANATSKKSRATTPLLLHLRRILHATVVTKSESQRFQSRCCLNDIDQRLSQKVPLPRGYVVHILSVVFTVELETR